MFYNVRTTSAEGTFRVTKFDADLNPVASYLTSADACECPAGVRPSCRHRDMVPVFAANGRIDTAWVCQWGIGVGDFDWRQFVGPLAANEAKPTEPYPMFQCPECERDLSIEPHKADCQRAPDGPEPQKAQPSPIIDTARLRRLLR